MSHRQRVRHGIQLICSVMFVTLVTGIPAVAGKKPYVEGDHLDFRLPDLDGHLVDASDPRLQDKVVLVGLWATWCPPCLSEIPTFIDLQTRLGPRGLLLVAIAFESEEESDTRRDRLREFVTSQGINYVVLDGGPPSEFEAALPQVKNVKGFPVEILVDRQGRVVEARNSYGFKKGWARKLERELDALLDPSP